jgi:hypothetical protein
MASLIPSGSASGTGSMTLAAPVTNSNQTVTIPDATGTVMVSGNMPAFSAYVGSTQGITGSAYVITPCNTEEFDTAGCYNNTGSTVTLNGISVPAYSFAPNVAGYYQISATYQQANSSLSQLSLAIFKDGTNFKVGPNSTANNTQSANMSCLIYLNGTSNYIGFYVYNAGSNTQVNGSAATATWFQASMVRSA